MHVLPMEHVWVPVTMQQGIMRMIRMRSTNIAATMEEKEKNYESEK